MKQNDLKRARTEPVDSAPLELPQRKEKIIKQVHHLTWAEGYVEGTNLITLMPIEIIEDVTLEVTPIVKAVYEDNVALLTKLLMSESPDLLCKTPNLIEECRHGSLLEIAAARNASQCLSFLRNLVQMARPELSLTRIACYTISQNNALLAQAQVTDVDILERAHSGELCYLYPKTIASLKLLYQLFRPHAYNLAKNAGNMKIARLLRPITLAQ